MVPCWAVVFIKVFFGARYRKHESGKSESSAPGSLCKTSSTSRTTSSEFKRIQHKIIYKWLFPFAKPVTNGLFHNRIEHYVYNLYWMKRFTVRLHISYSTDSATFAAPFHARICDAVRHGHFKLLPLPVLADKNEQVKTEHYRGTSLMRISAPLGPYCREMPRALWWS